MTGQTRLERDLPSILGDLAMGPVPDYIDDVLGRTVRMRQRPVWMSPERWIPMADITSRPAFMPRLPWRTIGVAIVILALLIAGVVAVIGSRQTKTLTPFGLADNGQLTYAVDGDIVTVDPTSGTVTRIVTGPEGDDDPHFSPDGTLIAFIRGDVTADPGVQILVVRADGSNPSAITPSPIKPSHFYWGADSRSIIVGLQDNSSVLVYDATKTAEPRVIATDADPYLRPVRPPDGSAILVRRTTGLTPSLIRVDLDTGAETVVAEGRYDPDLGAARWSPDGKQIVYNLAPADDPASQRLFIANADGSGATKLITEPGTWFDIDPTWSPDGTRIAFLRYEYAGGSDWLVRPLGIYTIADGSLREVGPVPFDARAARPTADDPGNPGEGFAFEWSPDGESLIAVPGEATGHPVVINARDGTWQNLDPIVPAGAVMETWQRLAR